MQLCAPVVFLQFMDVFLFYILILLLLMLLRFDNAVRRDQMAHLIDQRWENCAISNLICSFYTQHIYRRLLFYFYMFMFMFRLRLTQFRRRQELNLNGLHASSIKIDVYWMLDTQLPVCFFFFTFSFFFNDSSFAWEWR